MSAPFDLLSFARAVADGTHSGDRPDPDTVAGISDHRAAAGTRPVRAVPHGGGVALRRARPRLVLEQHLCGEHTGTHFDAPIHWISGKDLPNNAVDTIDAAKFIAPACGDRLLEGMRRQSRLRIDDRHSSSNGRRATAGSRRETGCCCAPTGRSARIADYADLRDDGAHTPGPEPAVVKWLVEERDVHGFGTETIGTDFGQGQHFNPPYPAHFYMHGKGRFGLQCLTNLDLLPPTGAVIIAAPLKIKQGLGQPVARSGAGAGRTAVTADNVAAGHRRIDRHRCGNLPADAGRGLRGDLARPPQARSIACAAACRGSRSARSRR